MRDERGTKVVGATGGEGEGEGRMSEGGRGGGKYDTVERLPRYHEPIAAGTRQALK